MTHQLQHTTYQIEQLNYETKIGDKGKYVEIAPSQELLIDGPNLSDPTLNSPNQYFDRLDEINDTWRVIRDPVDGQKFEIAEVNTNKSADKVDLELSTYSSAIRTNPGNAAELAFRGMVTPDTRRLYVATMGNGSSDNFSSDELKDLRSTGRLTTGFPIVGGIKAQPTIQALHRALEAEKIGVRRLSADSFGGVAACALMAAFEPNQISHAYFKSRPNISRHNPVSLAAGMLIVENEINGRRNRRVSEDAWGLHQNDFALKHIAEMRLKRVYSREHTPVQGSKFEQLHSYARGISRGGRTMNPALLDTVGALERQPSAQITIDAPHEDVLYRTPEDIERFFLSVVRFTLSHSLKLNGGSVAVIRTEGTHGGHTWEPQRRAAAEAYAFGRK